MLSLKRIRNKFKRKPESLALYFTDEQKSIVDELETKIRKSLNTYECSGRDKTILNVTVEELKVLKSVINQINF